MREWEEGGIRRDIKEEIMKGSGEERKGEGEKGREGEDERGMFDIGDN